MRTITTANIEFGLIPKEHWFQPSWINEEKASASRKKMEEDGVIYGGSLPYRNMCRYNSGFFYLHPLMLKYKWYWRVEPDVHFTCDIDFDPFLFMEGANKTYGFTLTLYEFDKTIPTLWDTVKDFMREHPQAVARGNAMGWMTDNDGVDYNRCHCKTSLNSSFLL
jgi:alpha 1,2-mannosyltransferase